MATLVLDHFTDADSTSLDAHTPDTRPGSNAWVEALGNWQITGNKAVLAALQGWAQAHINSGQANCTVSVNAKSTTAAAGMGKDVGLLVRWASNGTYNDWWSIGVSAADDRFRIIEVNDGVSQTERAGAAVMIDTATVYAISATLSGSTITATVDGGNQISYASASMNQTSTIHGIIARETTDTLDDFLAAAGGAAAIGLPAGSLARMGVGI